MVDAHDGPPLESRPPLLEDLIRLCAELLLRTKQTVRDKDRLDRLFLEQLLASQGQ